MRHLIGYRSIEVGDVSGEAQGLEKDGLSGLNASGGFYSTYRAVSLRLLEMFGLLALADDEYVKPVADWLKAFIETNPGASQPMSDRWAVSLIPAAIVLNALDPDATAELLRRVTRWTCDYYDGDCLGLAAPDADAQREVDFLLQGASEHVNLAEAVIHRHNRSDMARFLSSARGVSPSR